MNDVELITLELNVREETFKILENRLNTELESQKKLLESLNDQANSRHPESIDTVRRQIRIQGEIEGLHRALRFINYERLFG